MGTKTNRVSCQKNAVETKNFELFQTDEAVLLLREGDRDNKQKKHVRAQHRDSVFTDSRKQAVSKQSYFKS
jgi:hypothetical protein